MSRSPCSHDASQLLHVQVLYLHGNRIASLATVRRLAALPRLAKLTLHGNPVAERRGSHRSAAIAALPGLSSLDFSPLTKLERTAAAAEAARCARRAEA
jgi:hypothetical protein